MADKRRVFPVDYAQLHNVSSVVLYDTSSRKSKRSKLYDVERIIERRKTKHVRFFDRVNVCSFSFSLPDNFCFVPGKLPQSTTMFYACKQDHEYLIQWKGWPMDDCSWEPSENLTEALIRYDQMLHFIT